MEAFALDAFARTAHRAGQYERARTLHIEALAILEELGDRRGVARVLTQLAELALTEGDGPRARGLLRQSLAIRQELGDMPGLASTMESLAGRCRAGGSGGSRAPGWRGDCTTGVDPRRSFRHGSRPPMTSGWPISRPGSAQNGSSRPVARAG